MTSIHHSHGAACFVLLLAACERPISIGDLGGLDASEDDGVGAAGTGGTPVTTTGTGGSTSGGGTGGSGGEGGTGPGTGAGGTAGSGAGGGAGSGIGGNAGTGAGGSAGTGTGGGAGTGAGGNAGTGAGGSAGSGASGDAGNIDANHDGSDASPFRCASRGVWTGGSAASQMMMPGVPCMDCHGPASTLPFTMAGTVYSPAGQNDDDNCAGIDGTSAAIAVFDELGGELVPRLQVNQFGNFYTQTALPPSYRINVIFQGRVATMQTSVTNGDCNSCHSADGRMGAKGRITTPSP